MMISGASGCCRWKMRPKYTVKWGNGDYENGMKVYGKFHPLVMGMMNFIIPAPFNALTRGAIDSLREIFTETKKPGLTLSDIVTAIRPIIHDELTMQTIDEKHATLQAILDWYELTYLNLLGDYDLTTLEGRRLMLRITLLENKVSQARELAVLFSRPRFSKKGLGFFQLAATLHLSLLQQQILTDPNQLDADQSSYKHVWQLWRTRHAKRGRKILKDLANARIHKLRVQWRDYQCQKNQYINGWGIKKQQNFYIADTHNGWLSGETVVPFGPGNCQGCNFETWGFRALMKNYCLPRARHLYDEFVTGYKDQSDVFKKWDDSYMILEFKTEQILDHSWRTCSTTHPKNFCGYVEWN